MTMNAQPSISISFQLGSRIAFDHMRPSRSWEEPLAEAGPRVRPKSGGGQMRSTLTYANVMATIAIGSGTATVAIQRRDDRLHAAGGISPTSG
jgi:hypothetical protein